MRLDKSQCPGCGWTNETCICDPRGGFFVSTEDKREYYSTHPDSKGRVRLIPFNHEEILWNALRMARPEKSEDELQNLLNNLAKEIPGGWMQAPCNAQGYIQERSNPSGTADGGAPIRTR